MLYKINHNFYNNFDVFEYNKMPPRAYFIPFESREALEEIMIYKADIFEFIQNYYMLYKIYSVGAILCYIF